MKAKQPAPLGTVLREDARERTDWPAITVVEAERDKALAERDEAKREVAGLSVGVEEFDRDRLEAESHLSEALAALREIAEAKGTPNALAAYCQGIARSALSNQEKP